MFIASIVTAAIAIAVILSVLICMGKNDELSSALVAFSCTLPMCWIMYHVIRLPLDDWLLRTLGNGDVLFWFRTAYAPLTEEPAKQWPLVLPFVRRSLTRQNLTMLSIALGGGFAVGEIFTFAGIVQVKMPEVAKLPWCSLGGFINERLMTCAAHSGMTANAIPEVF